ncbi:EscU/YscU/HrcU family type III secretion system export apparatus switch protein [bacterium]|jgi:flagellar biosynthetic protein FlhB|nr:EscU/YscU/HrcU family type III secretion system export apparatus switch protein [bacterium]
MSDDNDKDQKTEDPTERRRSEAHGRGEFARSAELGVVFSLAGALCALSVGAASGGREIAQFTAGLFAQLHTIRFEGGFLPLPVYSAAKIFGIVVLPMLAASVIAALLSGGLQSGFQLTPDTLGFNLDKLNPLPGFTRLFSKATAVHGLVDFLKMLAIGFCLWLAMRNLLEDPLFSTPVEVSYLGEFIRRGTLALLSRIILVLGCVAGLSYAYEKHRTNENLMMTKEEVKEEHKQAEGNVKVKMAIRRLARRLIQRQMLKAVATADVVITNPTHYAVALKYERGVDSAPVVLAKGDNALARRIKALAAEHEVPMVENRPVARMLFATATVGEPIPAELFQAVAGILAFVYRTHRYYFHRLSARRAGFVNGEALGQ